MRCKCRKALAAVLLVSAGGNLSAAETFDRRLFFPGETAVLGPTTETTWCAEDDLERPCGAGHVEKGVLSIRHADLGGRFGAFRISCGTNVTWIAFLSSRRVKPCPWIGTVAGVSSKDEAANRRLVDFLATAGLGVIRSSPWWKVCEKKKGVYRMPPVYDAFVDDLRAHGIRLNLGMKYENRIYDNPIDPKAFAAWCEWTAKHFLGRVDTFEIWNEPENFQFGPIYGRYGSEGKPAPWYEKFIEFTHGASDAIRRANPKATVAVAAEDLERRLVTLLEMGIARKHEAIAFHPYCHDQHRPERAYFLRDGGKRLRTLARKHGGCNRWFVTESGWTTYSGTGVWWQVAGRYPRASYAGQAECLIRMYLTSVASGIEYALQYNFNDAGPRREYTEHNFGIVHQDYSPKPSYAAIAAMTRLLEDAVHKESLSAERSRYRVERFEQKDRSILACWAVEGETAWRVPAALGTVVACLDLMGNPLPLAADGRYVLTERPFYLVVGKPTEPSVPTAERYTLSEREVFVDNEAKGRSGHMGHALVDCGKGRILDFFSNCAGMERHRGHSGYGWMEYRVSTDYGKTFGPPRILDYSKKLYDEGRHTALCEKAIKHPNGKVVLFFQITDATKPGCCEPWSEPTMITSDDDGETWSEPRQVCPDKGRIYDVVTDDRQIYFIIQANPHFIGSRPEHVYKVYRWDGSGPFVPGVVSISAIGRGYAALCFGPDGALHAFAYCDDDRRHLAHAVSRDRGVTWEAPDLVPVPKGCRNPQIVRVGDLWFLGGRCHACAEQPKDGGSYVLYTSTDGVSWDAGRLIDTKPPNVGTGYYSHMLPIQEPGCAPRILLQYSRAYAEHCVNVCHRWITPVRCTAGNECPQRLTTEYRTDPTGLDMPCPRFGWQLPKGFARQTAYEIEADGWKSGKVASSEQVGVVWAGRALSSRQRVTWRVRVWEDDKVSDWSAPASFSMALLESSDWQAKWIGPCAATRPPVDMNGAQWIANDSTNVFRKVFELETAPTGVCELAFTTRNQFKVLVNGRTAADTYWEHFHDWNYIRTLDVHESLRVGSNELTFIVTPFEGERPSLVARLDCGSRVIVSDASWGRPIPDFKPKSRRELQSPKFARTFDVRGPVVRAVLYVTGVGFYEARLDGVKIGDKVLDPAPTDYAKRVLYSTYEVAPPKPGRHELSLLVGHGWYDQRSLSAWNFDNAPWRDFPRAIAQFELTYADGRRDVVATDRTWRQVASEVRYDDIREGEVIAPGATGEWGSAEEVPAPAGRLTAELQPGAKIVRRLQAQSVRRTGADEYVVTFPENIAGWMRMTLRGLKKGQVVSFTYDERLAKDGSPARSHDWRTGVWGTRNDGNKRMIDIFFAGSLSYGVLPSETAAFQRDRFIASGRDVEVYEPRFTFNGFRHVVIRGLGRDPDPQDMEACVVSTDFPQTGTFACSDATFNRLMANAARSYRGNFTDGFPTDCPHREKNGWMGDASMASEMAQYLFDNTSAYEKWLRDMLDAQRSSGELPCIVPTGGWGFFWGNGPGWDSALPTIAWELYRHKGDRRILETCFPAVCRLCDYTARERTKDGIVSWGIGDHASPVRREAQKALAPFTTTCFALQANEFAAQMADALDRAAEGKPYRNRARDLRRAIRAKWLTAPGIFVDGGQTAQAMALEFGLVEADERAAAEAALVAAFARANDHLEVGIYGMKFVLRALSHMGRTDLAWKALLQPTDPTPVRWTLNDATTLGESWEDQDASLNHIMFGSFAGWAYAHLAGIRPLEPGYRKICLAPEPIDALSHLSASVETPYGRVSLRWERRDGEWHYVYEVPPGTTAEVHLPRRAVVTVGPGRYHERVR